MILGVVNITTNTMSEKVMDSFIQEFLAFFAFELGKEEGFWKKILS